MTPCGEIGFAALNGGKELRRHLPLVFEPLLQPFLEVFRV